MKHLRFITALLLAAALTFGSCSKEGPQGPAGPQGQQGEQGPAGKQGPQGSKGDKGPRGAKGATGTTGARGPRGATGAKGDRGPAGPRGATGPRGARGPKGDKGDPGTANVVASKWISYNWNSFATPTRKTMLYIFPHEIWGKVGQSDFKKFMNNGGVFLVYGENSGTLTQHLFPYEYSNARFTEDFSDVLYLNIESINGRALTEYDYSSSKNNKFRYILIPAGVLINGRKSSPPPDYNDYHAVCEYYEIPE